MNALKITDTTMRDGHQSLWATRMKLEEMLPVLEKIDAIGYHSLEVWGGATFDVCLRFLNEDPWERLRTIKKVVKKTPLQMLLRGQSLLGYSHYPDDIVERFVDKSAENGIDIFRIFDAMNDVRNLQKAMECTKKAGKHVQASVVYTISPVHTLEYYVETALKLQDLGADSICVKDMAGLLAPYAAYELISALKTKINIPIQLHTHYVGGMALATYLKAAESGVDVIDTASVPLAFGSSQPPVETMVRIMEGSGRDTGLDMAKLLEVANHFDQIRQQRGFNLGSVRTFDIQVFKHQVPGGMISNFLSQLEEQKALDRLDEVLAEIPRVREDFGYPPLVTPTSQLVGTQAVVNVLSGGRYKMVIGEARKYLQGYYGKIPGKVNEELRRKVLKNAPAIDCRPADMLEPKWEQMKAEIGDLAKSDEDVLSYALFPMVARKFFEDREAAK